MQEICQYKSFYILWKVRQCVSKLPNRVVSNMKKSFLSAEAGPEGRKLQRWMP